MSSSTSFDDMYSLTPQERINIAIVNIMTGDKKHWKYVEIETENARTSLTNREVIDSITSQNARLTREHTDFIKKYNSMPNSKDRELYQTILNIIKECRIKLFDIATTGDKSDSDNVSKLKPLFLLEEIEEWINALNELEKKELEKKELEKKELEKKELEKKELEKKELAKKGGRRRKTNKVKKSKMHVFRRRSSKSKKSRKSRKYVR